MRFDEDEWAKESSPLVQYILASNAETLAAYKARPLLVFEHTQIERATVQGGYSHRQLFELIQNGADALVGTRDGRVKVVLTEEALYCANEGEPIDQDGIDALLSSHISEKRGSEIGRFGLGFKSVLGVTSVPEFYSWTACFAFDSGWAHDLILSEVKDLGPHNEDSRTPVLRLATPIDPSKKVAADPVLKELMTWATTVVKLPLDLMSDWLADDLATFPGEFLLFSPHVGELVIEDRTTNLKRTIHISMRGDRRVLVENETESEWMVFERLDYKPSAEALADAGELAHRETVPVIWAVPVTGKERSARGRFWAFFPTEFQTTMAGILNAPWKTNEDRQNLLSGPFNNELLTVVARILVDNLPALVEESDPGRYLELLPARGREAADWADTFITDKVYQLLSDSASLPDQVGRLRHPSELRIHPDSVDEVAMEAWESHEERPRDWVHGSVLGATRRSRAVRLLQSAGGTVASVASWLEAVCEDGSKEGSSAALRAATALVQADARVEQDVRGAFIVLTSGGEMALPRDDVVFFPHGEYSRSTDEVFFVEESLAADPETRAALVELGIHEADPLGELKALLSWGIPDDQDWEAFWSLVRRSDPRGAAELLREAGHDWVDIRVRTASGEFHPWYSVLMPGRVVSTMSSDDASVVVDTDYHADDLIQIRELGVSEEPKSDGGSEWESWFSPYERECRRAYYRALPSDSSRPHEYLLGFRSAPLVGPLEPLRGLSSDSAARFTLAALELIEEEEWEFAHETQDKYPVAQFTAPDLWLLRKDGWVETTEGPVPVSECVGPRLSSWAPFMRVAKCTQEIADLAGLPSNESEVPEEIWYEALERAESSTEDSAFGQFYAEASPYIEPPLQIRCRVGSRHEMVAPSEITAVYDQGEFVALLDPEDFVPVVLVKNQRQAEMLVENWGLTRPGTHAKSEVVYQPAALGSNIAERFPPLSLVLGDNELDIVLVPCEAIQEVTLTRHGRKSVEASFRFDRDTDQIFYRSDLSEVELLNFIIDALSLPLGNDEVEAIAESRKSVEKAAEMSEISKLPNDAARLARLVESEQLRAHLPQNLIETVGEEKLSNPVELAGLALAVHGVTVLKELRSELTDQGWPTPSQWAGSRDARAFVARLGFGPAYAGFETRRPDPLLTVDGPAELPAMHAFQTEVSSRVEALVGKGKGRGLISLPTGAGKTRVAVESLISSIKAGRLEGPVLWVAQTEELCEQAVQTWAYIWRAVGGADQLHIGRLWGGNEVSESRSIQVVVATVAKLENLYEKESYEWLSQATSLVIDEAHGSITPQYTRLLSWQGMARSRDRVPLIGLTATPFRGTSEDETERLVNRYKGNRLDLGVFGDADPYDALQDEGVLAKVDHQLLKGTKVRLSDEELGSLQETRLLPASVGQRIGADASRNKTIVASIDGMPRDWPILLFAASVDHAQTMAALLTRIGITARAISATTDRGARRYYVEAFRSGEIQVLTNYNVLSQGFDAPATRAVYIARPTFSPNLYQQMIGRGLRGPANGGKDVCLIVNVEDNFSQFGERLAFREFEYLWKRKRGQHLAKST